MLLSLLFVLAAGESPKAQLQATVTNVRQVLKDDSAAKRNTALRSITVSYIDFSRLAQNTLDEQWAKLNPAKRKEFAKVLEDLIEASYLGKLDQSSTVDLTIGEEKIEGDKATLHATAHVQGADSDLVFHLYKGAQQWMADDVELDDVSLTRNYRTQFARTIAKDGYPVLVAKLKKKTAEAKAAPAPAGKTAASNGAE